LHLLACHEDGYPDLGSQRNVFSSGIAGEPGTCSAREEGRFNIRLIGTTISPLRRVGFPLLEFFLVFRNKPSTKFLIGRLPSFTLYARPTFEPA